MKNNPVFGWWSGIFLSKFIALIILDFYAQLDVNSSSDLITSYSIHYHVYAALAPYTGSSVEFYKIPDRVLEHIGFSQRQDSFNNENDTDA